MSDPAVGAREAMERGPKFGEWFTGIYASDDNPQKHGMYVRTIRRTSTTVLNRGSFYELTDGKGSFWESPVENVVRMERPRSDAASVVSLEQHEKTKRENEQLRDPYENLARNRARGWTIDHLLECEESLRQAEAERDQALEQHEALREAAELALFSLSALSIRTEAEDILRAALSASGEESDG